MKNFIIKKLPILAPLFIILLFTFSLVLFINPKISKKCYEYKKGLILATQSATFSYASIEEGSLTSDIKPRIFNFVFENTDDNYFAFVVDLGNLLNPYFWERKDKLTIGGIVFKESEIEIIQNKNRINIPYSLFISDGIWNKQEVLEGIEKSILINRIIIIITIILLLTFSLLIYLPIFIIKLIKRGKLI